MSLSARRDATILLRDGRQLAYAEWGDPAGRPMLAFHGAPGSRLWSPDDYDPGRTSTEAGVRLLTVDRPGYGRSDPLPGRPVVDSPDDIEQLLDALDIDSLPIVGASAGGPYALACAARIPGRVTRVGTVGGRAPTYHVPGAWEQLDADWRQTLERAVDDRVLALDAARERHGWLITDPEGVADPANWPDVDRWLASDAWMRAALLAFVREAGRQGVDGYAWDVISIDMPWGFELSEVAAPAWVWQGDQDDMVGYELLCGGLPDVTGVLYPGEGHLLRGHWGDVYAALTDS